MEFPMSLKGLESVIGLASWNWHLIPFLSHQMVPLQKLKMELLREWEAGELRAWHIQWITLTPTDKELRSFKDIKEALINLVCNYHFIKGQLLIIFLDASKAWGMGAAIYQSIATDSLTQRKYL